VAFIIIAYSLITLAWQLITGAPPPWADWFAAHLLLIVMAALYLSQSYRAAAYDRVVRWRIVTPGRDLGDG